MGPYPSPGAHQAATDGVHYVFKDAGEPKQLLAILLLGFFALYAWYQANRTPVEDEDE